VSERSAGSPAGPAITIGIPVYNRERLVRIALESALRQKGDHLEILVCDNASTDRTWETLNSYRDPRLRLVRNPSNLGLFGNFNRCIFLARGRYLVTLCSDDALRDGWLEPARDLLERHAEVGLVSSRGRATDEASGATYPLGDTLPAGLYEGEDAIVAVLWAFATYYHNPFNYPSGILVRTELARACAGMDESLRYASDVKLYLAMLERSSLAVLDLPGCDVLFHGGAEQNVALGDPCRVREFVDHFDRHAALLERRGLLGYVRSHVGGYLLGSYFKQRALGRREVARAFLAAFLERRGPLPGSLVALVDSVRRRAAWRRAGLRAAPVSPRALPVG
jgi:glycosyltransferase involved in cell wall biosynthesis